MCGLPERLADGGQLSAQRCRVDDWATRGVDQEGRWLHHAQEFCRDHARRLGVQWNVQRHEV